MTKRVGFFLVAAMLAACSGGESSGPKSGNPANIVVLGATDIGTTAGSFQTADSIAIKVTDESNNPVAGQTVTFSIVAGGGSATPATKSTGSDGVARTAWTVGNAGAQALRATVGSLNVDITANAISCNEITLGVGQVQSLNPESSACAILNGKAQRYIITIVNAKSSPDAALGYKAAGRSGGTLSASSQILANVPSSLVAAGSGIAGEEMSESLASERAHALILRKNMELLEQYGPKVHAALNTNAAAAQAARPSVGDLIPMKVPDITVNGCNSFTPLTARVVYVGSKGIVLEDTENVLKGQVDTLLTRVGHEFDDVIFPILTKNFGNPLAMDAQLNNDGALYMLVSDKVNKSGATGFVSNADLLPTSQCPSSNMAEVFYARGLTPPGTNTGPLDFSFASTSRRLASVIIHESKHLTSAATKISLGWNGQRPFEDAWLEESSAEIAMELLSRVTYSLPGKFNLDYTTTLAKEARPASGLPLNMFHPFSYLYTYFAAPETHSLAGPAGAGDFTFYGSGWAFLRWVIDTYAANESAFLTAMTRDFSNWGMANIENLTGKSFAQLFSEFSLAVALDDYPDFTPSESKYSFPSWNLRSIFAGMNTDFPNLFPSSAPLNIRSTGFGKFTFDFNAVRGGGFSLLQLSGTQANKQLLEFKAANGAALSADMRVNIARVQ
ncbi:MAG TPA: hypothetical protein VF042_06670 [Gemmatimonadaceae bacterium]